MYQIVRTARFLHRVEIGRCFSSSSSVGDVPIARLLSSIREPTRQTIYDTHDIQLPFQEGNLALDPQNIKGMAYAAGRNKLDLENKKEKDKLTVKIIKCPGILLDKLRAQVGSISSSLKVSLVKLSYENYQCPKEGRKDCIELNNALNLAFSKEFTFSCFSSNEDFLDDRILYLFNMNSCFSDGNCQSLYANVTTKDDVTHISTEKDKHSVGIIYVISTRDLTMHKLRAVLLVHWLKNEMNS